MRGSWLVTVVAIVAVAPHLAAQPSGVSPRRSPMPPTVETEIWTPVPRRVQRREPTLLAPLNPDLNVPEPVALPPAHIGAAATRGSAVLDPPNPDEMTYHRPVVLDPGFFQVGETIVRIAGIVPLSIDQHCPSAAGEPWPCGRRALAALRDLIRQRPVHCVESGRDEAIVIGRCRVGRTDIAAWLVERGWAQPLGADERLQRLSDAAREARIGQFATESGAYAP
jgi:endonuclease YncB( thermonuclease family)